MSPIGVMNHQLHKRGNSDAFREDGQMRKKIELVPDELPIDKGFFSGLPGGCHSTVNQYGDICTNELNQEVTLPEPDIFKLWDKECGEGDWVLVNTENGTCHYIPGEDSAAPSTIVAEAADDFYYAFYDEAKGKLSALVANKIYNRSKSKSKNHDGVIYFFKKYQEPVHAEVGNINFENF
ncbi:MAG: hypothetical protein Q9196_002349 [Gyalolechia fulgens]